MTDPGSTPAKPADDLTIVIGEHRFDPVAEPVRRRRGRSAPRARSSAGATARGSEPADPADTRIVQFTRPLAAEDIDRFRSDFGLALTAYVPNNAYVERVPEGVRRRLPRDPLVRAVVPYLPEFKQAASVADPDRQPPESVAAGDDQLDALLFDRGDPDLVVEAVEGIGGRDVIVLDDREHGGFARIRFTVERGTPLVDLAELDDVRWIEPVPRRVADNVAGASVNQSGDPGNATIWAKGIHGEGQVIGIIDQGPPDLSHCFFADAAPNQPGPTHRKVLEVRNVSSSPPNAHATFVGGCAVGDDLANAGTHASRGGAWAAKLVAGNFNDADTMLAQLNAARFAGAFIHSNSWHDPGAGPPGSPGIYNQTAHDVDNFMFINEDHLVFGSSGNIGNHQNPPGTAKNTLCISAGSAAPNQLTVGNGNPGPTADGRRKPDLVSVGQVVSATVGTPCGTAANGTATSWATPHAAAAAALVRQYLVEGWWPSGVKASANAFVPTGALLKAILANSTVDMVGTVGNPSNNEGWGLLRLDRTLVFAGGRRRMSLWDVRHATGVTTGQRRQHVFDVAGSTEQLKVTMAFTDPPPAVGSFAAPVVNDLDLLVTAPDGTIYEGNALANGVSIPGGGVAPADGLNCLEQVVIDDPRAGRWTIEVIGLRVAVGGPGQGYALVTTAELKPKSGCFVATAVYGDADHPDVAALRRWRDSHLLPGARGRRAMRAFTAAYEVVGPVAAGALAGRPRLRTAVRRLLVAPIARAVSGGR